METSSHMHFMSCSTRHVSLRHRLRPCRSGSCPLRVFNHFALPTPPPTSLVAVSSSPSAAPLVVVGRTTADVAFELREAGEASQSCEPASCLAIAIPRVAGAITLRQQHFYARSVRTNPWAHITTGVVGTCWSTCTTAWGVLGKHAAQEFRRALVHGSWTADTPMLLLSGVAKHCNLPCPTREAGVQCLETTPGCSW